MKAITFLITFCLCSHNVFSQKGFTVGFDFGKSASLNNLIYNKEAKQNITRHHGSTTVLTASSRQIFLRKYITGGSLIIRFILA